MAVVLVEQSAELALQVADRAVFLEKGETRFSGPAQEILDRGDLVRSVFLAGARDRVDGAVPEPATTCGRAPALRRPGAPHRPGAAQVASAGSPPSTASTSTSNPARSSGSWAPTAPGKTTLLDALSGFVMPDAGHGARWATSTCRRCRPTPGPCGASAAPSRTPASSPGLTVTETLAVSCERWVTSREPLAAALRLPASLLSEAEVVERVERILALLRLSVFRDRFASELSTGSRRLVEFGCLLAQEPEVLLLDEPSAGLARAEAEALAPVLKGIRDATGAALVIVEHDVPLLRADLRPARGPRRRADHRQRAPGRRPRRPGGRPGLPRPRPAVASPTQRRVRAPASRRRRPRRGSRRAG